MNIFSKISPFLVLGFVFLFNSCDFSGSIVKKVKDFTTNSEKYKDDDKQEKYVVNEEQLDSISRNLYLLEHRVYYIDCSGSMISGGRYKNKYKDGSTLLDRVKDSLESSLLSLDVDSVDIDIIPFLGKKWNNGILQANTIRKRGSYTSTDREGIHKAISSISVPEGSNSWNTHHYYPINDFLDNRISNKKQYHIMILLTDGNDEEGALMSGAEVLQNKWFSLCKKNKIYGIFDDLNGNIKGTLPDTFNNNGSSKLFYIKGAEFNINIFQLSNTADEVLLRKDSLIRIPFAGKIPAKIDILPKEDEHYRYDLVCQPSKNDKYLKIKVSAVHDGKLPDSWSPTLHFFYNWGEKKESTKNFPDEDTIIVTIVDEKTPKLELCEADLKFEKGSVIKRRLTYYKKWHSIGKEYSDTATLSLSYCYSKDVTDNPSFKQGSIRIEGLSEYVCLLDSLNNNITNQEILLPKIPSGRINLKLTLTPGNTLLEGNKVDSAKIRFIGFEKYNTIKWNGKRIEKTGGAYIVSAVNLKLHEKNNPIKDFFLWILFLLIGLLLLGMYIIWHHRTFSLRFPTEGRAVFAAIDDAANIQLCGALYKGEHIVDYAINGSNTINSELLNPYYIKEIIILNPDSESPKKVPEQPFWDNMWNGDIICVNGKFQKYPINHLVIKPVGTITNEDIEISIFFDPISGQNIPPQIIILPIHEITPINLITPGMVINNTSVQLFGKSPRNAKHRTFLQRVINKSINIFN